MSSFGRHGDSLASGSVLMVRRRMFRYNGGNASVLFGLVSVRYRLEIT